MWQQRRVCTSYGLCYVYVQYTHKNMCKVTSYTIESIIFQWVCACRMPTELEHEVVPSKTSILCRPYGSGGVSGPTNPFWMGVQRKIGCSWMCARHLVLFASNWKLSAMSPILVVAHARAMPPTLHFHIIAYVSGYTILAGSQSTSTPDRHPNATIWTAAPVFSTQIFGKIRTEIWPITIDRRGEYCTLG